MSTNDTIVIDNYELKRSYSKALEEAIRIIKTEEYNMIYKTFKYICIPYKNDTYKIARSFCTNDSPKYFEGLVVHDVKSNISYKPIKRNGKRIRYCK